MEKYKENHSKLNRLVFIICLVLLFLANLCFGQMCLERDRVFNNTVTRIIPCTGITYVANSNDVFLSIFADSLNFYDYAVNIYVYYTKEKKLNKPKLLINFEDYDIMVLEVFMSDPESGYVQFHLTKLQFEKVRDFGFSYVNFLNGTENNVMTDDKNDFFRDFIRSL